MPVKKKRPMKPRPCLHCRLPFVPHHRKARLHPACKRARQIALRRLKCNGTMKPPSSGRYFPRTCDCGEVFTPTSGRQKRCEKCRYRMGKPPEDVVAVLLRCARVRFEGPFDLDREWFEATWAAQGGRCALSGVPMTRERGKGHGNLLGAKGDGTKVSIDRIDSAKNYTRDNCRLVCVVVNLMKHKLSDPAFFKWCERVLVFSVFEREVPKWREMTGARTKAKPRDVEKFDPAAAEPESRNVAAGVRSASQDAALDGFDS